MFMKDLIFDVGCNNGDDTDFYLRKGFRVVAIDADPPESALPQIGAAVVTIAIDHPGSLFPGEIVAAVV